MNKVIIGFGYIIPTSFYEVDHPDLMVFDSNAGISFVTFTHKHIMIDDFNGKSIAIDDSITPIIEEVRMIGVFCGTEELPSLQVFTTSINDSEINKPTNEKPNYYYDSTFDYPQEEIIPNIIQQQNDEYEESLKVDQMKELQKEIDQAMFNSNVRDNVIETDFIETKITPELNTELNDVTSCFTMNGDNITQFNRIADNIINEMLLMINNDPYRIVEVEFYYQEDSDLQYDEKLKNFGTWDFNKNNMSIVFGTNNFNGNILIRSIQCLETEELISGPSDCVDKIISLNPDIKINNFNCDDFNCPIHLIKSDTLNDKIHRSIRVGLLFGGLNQLKYLTKPYRFMIRTDPAIEIGRPHLIVQMAIDGESLMRIVDITGSEKSDVIKYIKAYERGKNINTFEKDVISDEDLCELCGYASK